MRLATIDIGTNTVLLLVAEKKESGEIVALEEHATITRLGEGVDRSRVLAPAAIARTNACLDDYAKIVRDAGVSRVAVVGTSAMRDAGGGEQVRAHVKAAFGVEARTISGDEESQLTFAGALVGLPRDAGSHAAVFDIGGGSTEIVLGRVAESGAIDALDSIVFARSFDVGSVRLTERHVRSDPPSASELDAIAASLRDALSAVPPLPSSRPPVGIAGTVTTLAAVSLAMPVYEASRVHGMTMSTREVRRVVEMLAALPQRARAAVPGLEPKRADVIVAGGMIVLALLDHWKASELTVSDRGVRWGLALQLAE